MDNKESDLRFIIAAYMYVCVGVWRYLRALSSSTFVYSAAAADV